MKKLFVMCAVVAATFSFAACDNKPKESEDANVVDRDTVVETTTDTTVTETVVETDTTTKEVSSGSGEAEKKDTIK